MTKEESLRIRMDKEEKRKLKELADKENRSVSNWVRDKVKKEYEKSKK